MKKACFTVYSNKNLIFRITIVNNGYYKKKALQ